MSRLTELLRQARKADPQLGTDLETEIAALTKRRSFGLVFEQHQPGAVELPGRGVRRGDKVRVLAPRGEAKAGDQRLDAIYIDPPYNTGARDWKYNNDYVASDDDYRHSKWLAFMERRLKIARELLPDDSVLIVTIDEKEYLRLALLLEQTFPESSLQMVTSVIAPRRSAKGGDGLVGSGRGRHRGHTGM